MRRASTAAGVAALVVGAVCALALGLWLRTPHEGAGRSVRVELPRDGGAAAITRALWEARVVDRPWLFHPLVWVTGASLRARRGTVALRDDLTPWAVLRALRSGSAGLVRVTIPEGCNRFEIAERLAAAGVCGAEEFIARTEAPDAIVRAGLPEGTPSLEGYLFPDTYDLPIGSRAEAVVTRMVANFRARWDRLVERNPAGMRRAQDFVGGTEGTQGRRFGPDTKALVTLASIVERETGAPEDRSHVASVFWNRLLRREFTPRLLQSDPTAVYGCVLASRRGALPAGSPCARGDGGVARVPSPAMLADRSNPYNTYRSEGLTPTPICNPGERALEAALRPSADDDFYFVACGEGRSAFARDLADHRRNVERCLGRPSHDGT